MQIIEYRREIDGLRAVAVLPVILFHGGFGWFSGGFVGVDVFFVISGYLITSIILAEKAAGTFTLAGFYERRARRILPPLFFVLMNCTVFAWFFMVPDQLKQFSRGLIAISIFASNILFRNEANYFATSAELNPLLHTWSLAVEEQYYLAFPLFMVLLWPTQRRWLVGFLAILIVGVMSFTFAEVRSVRSQETTFYVLKARCWELLMGCLIAFVRGVKKDKTPPTDRMQRVNQIASLIGLALITYAVFVFNKGTRFPSVYTLIPTLGATLIILFADPGTIVNRLLSHPWIVGLGLISYSAYLWHQPIFAFARLLSFSSDYVIATLTICSIVLSYFTWRYVERPFRDRRKISRNVIVSAAVAMSAVTLGTGITLNMNNGFPSRLSKEQLEVLAFRDYPTTELYRTRTCLLQNDQPITAFSAKCDAKGGGQSEKLFLWGDSFAAHLYPAIKDLPRHTVEQYSTICPPLIGLSFDYGRDCAEVENLILAKIKESQPGMIVLSANWRKHVKYLKNLGATLERLKAISKDSEIILVGNVPQWEPSLPEVLARSHRTLRPDLYLDTPLLKELRLIDDTLAAAAALHQARFISPIRLLCARSDCLAVVANGDAVEPIAWDYGHLTKNGAIFLINSLGFAHSAAP